MQVDYQKILNIQFPCFARTTGIINLLQDMTVPLKGKIIYEGRNHCCMVQQCRSSNKSKIIRRLTFFTPSLTTRLIQKNCANIVKFKLFLKNKRNDILHKILNKTVVKLGVKKVKHLIIWDGLSKKQKMSEVLHLFL